MKKFTLILLLLTSTLAYSAELVVNQSGLPGSYLTIQSAIDAANPGDIILLDDGDVPYTSFTIDKDITIQPFNSSTDVREVITPVENITIISDSVNQVVLNSLEIYSITVSRNDSLDNTITYVNLINCYMNVVDADLPKVSLNMYYCTAFSTVKCWHGQFIANTFHQNLEIGGAYGASSLTLNDNDSTTLNTFINQSYSDVWGTNNLTSDTINLIANRFHFYNAFSFFTSRYFNFNIRNNWFDNESRRMYFHFLNTSGGNNIINNYKLSFNFWVYPLNADLSRTRVLNNNIYSANSYFYVGRVGFNNNGNASANSGIYAYNNRGGSNVCNFFISRSNECCIGSPSNEFLNLDLTRNTQGKNGGSYAWDNYHSSNSTNNNNLNKARIVDLNLPTQIFDPANISIKVKATHKN